MSMSGNPEYNQTIPQGYSCSLTGKTLFSGNKDPGSNPGMNTMTETPCSVKGEGATLY